MQQEDYIKKQIDQIGRILSKLMADLFNKNVTRRSENTMEYIRDQLKTELSIDLLELICLPTESFIHFLYTDREYTHANMEQFANLLLQLADRHEANESEIIYRYELYMKSLILFEFINKTDLTYSFDRHLKIARIKKELHLSF